MARQLLSFGVAFSLFVAVPATDAAAVDLPLRKAGLWEMKMVRTGGTVPDMTMQHCTDATTDKQMSTSFAPGKDTCTKQDIQTTPTGYVSDSVCTVAGMTVTSHAEITGDFNSAYTVKSTAHTERAGSPAKESITTVEAKWLGACKADQKPGDIVMPGGMKMNILELDKLKGMMPQLPQKAN